MAATMRARRNVARLACESEKVTYKAEADAEAGGELSLRTFAATVGVEDPATQI
jgi:predicted PhzF superfamily epimerase YddE/YHI9